jgi:hypothetical protein
MSPLLTTLAALALALLTCGWVATAWYYRRQLRDLHEQIDAVRETATEHARQARRQVGQLQAELAARPPLPASARERRAGAAATAPQGQGDSLAQTGSDHAFAATAILSDGFPATVLIRPPGRR